MRSWAGGVLLLAWSWSQAVALAQAPIAAHDPPSPTVERLPPVSGVEATDRLPVAAAGAEIPGRAVSFDGPMPGSFAPQPALGPVALQPQPPTSGGELPSPAELDGPQRVPRGEYVSGGGEIERLPPVVDRMIIWPYPPPQPPVKAEPYVPSRRERWAQMRHCLWLSASAGLFHKPDGVDPDLLLPMPENPWTFRAEAIGLHRSTGSNNTIGQLQDFSIPPVPLAFLTLDEAGAPGMQLGMKFQLAYQIDEMVSWETIYYGIQSWSTSQTLFTDFDPATGIQTNVAFSPFLQFNQTPPFSFFDTSVGYNYNSTLYNFEVNNRHTFKGNQLWTAIDTLRGFRLINFNDKLNINGFDTFTGMNENVDTNTRNYLVGGQIGAEVRHHWDKFRVGLESKAGGFVNFINRHNTNFNSGSATGFFAPATVPTGFLFYDTTRSETGVAGVLDFLASGTWQLTPRFSLRGGYQLLLISGLALSPDQLFSAAGLSTGAPDAATRVNQPIAHQGTIFIHGPTGGLELKW
jgi:hypothetical protein